MILLIAQDAVVQRSIIDKECHIASGCWIGCGDDYTPNKDEPDIFKLWHHRSRRRSKVAPGIESRAKLQNRALG
jgi:glucose-1-phosphate adenylyltransferase